MNPMPVRTLGTTGITVSILGLGGGGLGHNPQITGAPQRPQIRALAEQIIVYALDAGVNYFDTCSGYGESESILGQVAASRREEMVIASKCTTPTAHRDELCRELDQSLNRLRTDRLDLWLILNLCTMHDVDKIFEKNHAIDVFLEAKSKGLTRFIGISGHSSAGALTMTIDRCRSLGITLDTLLFSFNITDRQTGGHGRTLIRRCADASTGLVAMKVFGSDGAPVLHHYGISPTTALRYVWSQEIATAIVGIHSLEELTENIRIACEFTPMTVEERQRVEPQIGTADRALFTLTA